MITVVAGLVVGLALLAWSADLFVGNAARLARRTGADAYDELLPNGGSRRITLNAR